MTPSSPEQIRILPITKGQIDPAADLIKRCRALRLRAISRPRGGMVLWVELPPNVNCVELYRRALLAEIIIMPGTVFGPVGEIFNKSRISHGTPPIPLKSAAFK